MHLARFRKRATKKNKRGKKPEKKMAGKREGKVKEKKKRSGELDPISRLG